MLTPVNIIAFVFLAVLVVTAVAVLWMLRKQLKAGQVLGLQWLQAMRMMLMHVQKHRGLSAVYLSGDTNTKQQIEAVRQQISADIVNIASLGDWINDNQNWAGITQHWARLSATNLSISAEQNFDQHCRLIASLLVLLQETANKHRLENNSRFSEIKYIWHELLMIAELIGQSRARGVQVLSLRHHNASLAKHKTQIRRGLAQIELLLDHPACKRKFTAGEMQEVSGFVEFVRIHLVENIGPISATEYFNKASATIEIIYERFDQEIQKLQRGIISY